MKPRMTPSDARPPAASVPRVPAQQAPTMADRRPSRRRRRLVAVTAEHDLLEMASSVERLSMFTAAVRTAGLEDLLGEKGPFTIFAPTDRAFRKLPSTVLTALLADPQRLARVLCHHVVPGRVKAPKQHAPGIALPVSGDELSLTAAADVFHVDEARLVKTNIRATNGVIHAIDTVLMPSQVS
jgi:uncharacterized surface protein with fasciclin (FAS1) repeats